MTICSAGQGYVDGSTIDAASAQQISKQIKAAGAQYLEAPVSGPVFHKNSKRKNEPSEKKVQWLHHQLQPMVSYHCKNHWQSKAACT